MFVAFVANLIHQRELAEGGGEQGHLLSSAVMCPQGQHTHTFLWPELPSHWPELPVPFTLQPPPKVDQWEVHLHGGLYHPAV